MKPFVRLRGTIFTPIWSGSRLSEKYKRFAEIKTVGECWETSVVDDSMAEIIGEDISFADYIRHFDLDAPPLIKIIDAGASLSVQVHPDAATAAKFGGVAKNEFWYVLDADADSYILYGTVDGLSKEDVLRHIRSGDILPCLQKIPVKSSDCFMIPEGMIHALGAGVTVLEIQNRIGTTYRIKDISGNRETHVEESCACVEVFDASQAVIPHGKLSEARLAGVPLVSTSEYGMTRYVATGSQETFTIDDRGVYIFCESGSGRICGERFGSGDSFFIGQSGCEISLDEGTTVIFAI